MWRSILRAEDEVGEDVCEGLRHKKNCIAPLQVASWFVGPFPGLSPFKGVALRYDLTGPLGLPASSIGGTSARASSPPGSFLFEAPIKVRLGFI